MAGTTQRAALAHHFPHRAPDKARGQPGRPGRGLLAAGTQFLSRRRLVVGPAPDSRYHSRGHRLPTGACLSAILPGMAGFLFRLAAIVRQAYAVQAQLVRLAAIRERAPFAADSHDPLGRLGPAPGRDHRAPAQHRTKLLYIPLYTASRTRNIITLDLTNDGVPRSAASHRERGGLENLAERLGTHRGTLTTALVGDGSFCLLATVPVGLAASWAAGAPGRGRGQSSRLLNSDLIRPWRASVANA